MHARHVTDRQQVLADLARQAGDNRKETALAVGTAVGLQAQVVRIIGHVGYNVYAVDPVTLGDAGDWPVQMAEPTEAVNLAESFVDEGTLADGIYVLMFCLGAKNAFYAAP